MLNHFNKEQNFETCAHVGGDSWSGFQSWGLHVEPVINSHLRAKQCFCYFPNIGLGEGTALVCVLLLNIRKQASFHPCGLYCWLQSKPKWFKGF